jgi:pyruvate,orthophosphate dikinase
MKSCVQARTIAPNVILMSFGTNDLTHMTFGFTRDDIGIFLPAYLEQIILSHDPFMSLDQQGVGHLIRTALKQSRSVNKKLQFCIYVEHGGDPNSIAFFIKLDLTMSPAAHTVFQLPEPPQHRQVYKLLSIVFFNGHLLKILLVKN